MFYLIVLISIIHFSKKEKKKKKVHHMIRQVARANHVEMKTKFSYSRNDKEVDSKCETR